MSLKLIPLEPTSKDEGANKDTRQKNKHFNPGNSIRKNGTEVSLKNICLGLIHFVNRGSRYTFEQIDELIMMMERSILSLRKKKQEMMRKKRR